MTSGVYCITCLSTGRQYVGSSKNIEKRWGEHLNLLRKSAHENKGLQRAFDKYSEANFHFSVLENCSEDILLERETIWIRRTKSYQKGYNQTAEALPCPPRTESWRKGRRLAMIEMNKTRVRSEEEKLASSKRLTEMNKRLPHTEERRKKASERAKKMHQEGKLGSRK